MSGISATSRYRSAIRMITIHGEEAFKSQFVNNSWRRPLVSKRIMAVIRKDAIKEGTYGAFDPTTGKGWDLNWDKPRKSMPIRFPKETKSERTREGRASKIETLLDGADDRIETYRLEKEAQKPDPGVLTLYKKLMKGSGWKK